MNGNGKREGVLSTAMYVVDELDTVVIKDIVNRTKKTFYSADVILALIDEKIETLSGVHFTSMCMMLSARSDFESMINNGV